MSMRFVLGLAVAGALAASVLGSAAQLNVAGGSIQSGQDTSLICDNDGVHVSAWAANTIPGPYEGVDWVTLSGVNCDGGELTGYVILDNNEVAYFGEYNGSAQAANASGDPIINVGSATDYKIALHHDINTSQRWFVPAERIQGIKVWLGGDANF